MYIEQGYKGNIGLWKYLIIPILFIGVMGLNYVASLLLEPILGMTVEEMIAEQVAVKGKLQFLIEALIPLAIGLIIVLGWTILVHKQSIVSLTTSRSQIDWKRVLTMFLIWGVFSGGMIVLNVYLEPDNFIYNLDWALFLPLAVVAILLVPLQTSFEEYLFRAHMLQGLGIAVKNRWIPLIVTSVLFGVMHAANPEVARIGPIAMVFYIGTGFLLGIITLMDEGLELALGFHAANNLVAALLLTASWTAFQTDSVWIDISEPSAGWEIVMPVVLIYPLLLLLLSKIYKWKNWKERLTGRVLSKEEFENIENEQTA